MMGIIVGEANIIAGVPSMIVCGMEIAMYGTTMMVDAPSMIMSVAETSDSLPKLPMWSADMILSESSIIKDDVKNVAALSSHQAERRGFDPRLRS